MVQNVREKMTRTISLSVIIAKYNNDFWTNDYTFTFEFHLILGEDPLFLRQCF